MRESFFFRIFPPLIFAVETFGFVYWPFDSDFEELFNFKLLSCDCTSEFKNLFSEIFYACDDTEVMIQVLDF